MIQRVILIFNLDQLYHMIKKDVNVDEIRIPTGSIKTINKQDYQTWLNGKYLLVVRVYGKEWHEDTVIKRMVEIVG